MANSASKIKVSKSTSLLRRPTASKAKDSLLKALTYMGISVLGGGLAASIIGRPSFIVGAGLTTYGFYKDNPWLPALGLGMMASSHLVPNTNSSSLSGFSAKQEMEDAKARFSTFGKSLLNKTYLDKFIKPKSAARRISSDPSEETTEGFGSVSDNLKVLDQVERQLIANATAHQPRPQSQSTQGVGEDIEGMDDTDFSGF